MLKKHKIVFILVAVIAISAAVLTVLPIVLTLRCVSSDILITKFEKSIERNNTTKFERLLTDKTISGPFGTGMISYSDAESYTVLTERFHDFESEITSVAGAKPDYSWSGQDTATHPSSDIDILNSRGYSVSECVTVTGSVTAAGNGTSGTWTYELTIVKQGLYWYLADWKYSRN